MARRLRGDRPQGRAGRPDLPHRHRTESVAALVDQAGYRRVYNVTKSIAQWIGEGRPTEPYSGE